MSCYRIWSSTKSAASLMDPVKFRSRVGPGALITFIPRYNYGWPTQFGWPLFVEPRPISLCFLPSEMIHLAYTVPRNVVLYFFSGIWNGNSEKSKREASFRRFLRRKKDKLLALNFFYYMKRDGTRTGSMSSCQNWIWMFEERKK